MTRERLGGLDLWRAGLPLVGVVYHAFVMAPYYGAPLVFSSISVATHAFRMETFFALAGLLAGARLARKGYMIMRVRTLLVPLMTVYLFRFFASGGEAGSLLNGSTLHLWFLVTLTVVTVTAIVAERAGVIGMMISRWPTTIAVLAAWALLARASGFAAASWFHSSASVFGPVAIYFMPFFLAGVLIIRSQRAADFVLRWRQAWTIGCVGSSAFVLRAILDGNEAFQATVIGGMLLTVVAILWTVGILGTALDSEIKPAGNVSRWLSEAGFTVYVVHYPALLATIKVTGQVHWAPRTALCLVISLAVPLLIHAVAERVPLLRFLINGAPWGLNSWGWSRKVTA